ncbi:MAG: hypothetical protein IKH02_11080 [Prevotella sp.]|nr:hypothetical protein [Prevotella sp.]
MKKKYIEPEIILLALIGNQALMQESLTAFTGDPNDDTDEDEVDDIDDLLSNYGSRLWEE